MIHAKINKMDMIPFYWLFYVKSFYFVFIKCKKILLDV